MNFNGKKTFLSVGIIILFITGLAAVALLYFTGKGLTAKYLRAFIGDVQSQAELGEYYGYKDRQLEDALYWFKKAAKNGRFDEFATFAWHLVYENDPDGFEILKEAALAGDVNISDIIARGYLSPRFDPFDKYIKNPDPTATVWWHNKAIEQAEKINSKKMLLLLLNRTANLFLAFDFDKKDVNSRPQPDHKRALSYLEKAWKISNDIGAMEMGMIYLYGGYGVEKDEKKGVEYLLKETPGRAVYELAKIYFNGTGVPRDVVKANELTRFGNFGMLMPDDYDEKSEDNVFKFPREAGNELYKCMEERSLAVYKQEVILKRNHDKYIIKHKVYRIGKLDSELEERIPAGEWIKVEELINATNFFNLYSQKDLPSPDCGSYQAEGIKDGRLQLVIRFVDSADIQPLCDYLFELAGQKLYKE